MLAGETDGQGRERPGTNVQRAGDVTAVHVISSRKIDVEGALATAACHVWHGGEIPRPYDSLTEAGDELRPHLRSGRLGVWDRLRTAARFRDAEAREAHAALLADGSYDAYQAALGVANGKYRQVYEEATGRQAAAGAGSRARDPEAEPARAEQAPGTGNPWPRSARPLTVKCCTRCRRYAQPAARFAAGPGRPARFSRPGAAA